MVLADRVARAGPGSMGRGFTARAPTGAADLVPLGLPVRPAAGSAGLEAALGPGAVLVAVRVDLAVLVGAADSAAWAAAAAMAAAVAVVDETPSRPKIE